MRYKTKTKFIDALQFEDSKESILAIRDFMGLNSIRVNFEKGIEVPCILAEMQGHIVRVRLHDYIVKLSDGRFSSCSQKSFKNVYTKID